jgi:hypothetical protein
VIVEEMVGLELLLVGVGVEETEELELLVIELELDELDEEVVTEVGLVDDMLDEQEPSVVVSHGGYCLFPSLSKFTLQPT